MDLEKMEGLLEDINRQANKLIDLVRGLQNGEVFGEPLTTTQKTKLAALAKTRYAELKATMSSLEVEIEQ